jgi:hypothetical protein
MGRGALDMGHWVLETGNLLLEKLLNTKSGLATSLMRL